MDIAPLNDGRVLLAGGWDYTTKTDISGLTLYDPNSNMLTYIGNMSSAKIYPIMVVFKDGRVLIIGGVVNSKTTEIYTP